MLTQDHVEKFNDQHMRIYVPAFAQDSPEFDKIWLTFSWMIGQNYGFDKVYHFHHQDYKLLTATANGRSADDLCHEFNKRHGEWVKMGHISNYWSRLVFKQDNWEFVPYDLVDARLQRAFVTLYNAVWAGANLSTQLFVPADIVKKRVPPHRSRDTGWFQSRESFQTRTVERQTRDDHEPPHYLAQQFVTYRDGHIFSGTIVPQKIITNE